MNTLTLRIASGLSALAILGTAAASNAATFALGAPRAAQFNHRALVQSVRYDTKNMKLLYVSDLGQTAGPGGEIWVYNITANTKNSQPIYSITNGIDAPNGMATDLQGDLYVANTANNSVTIYLPGQTTPAATLTTGIISPLDVKVDAANNVYIANSPGYGGLDSIVEYSAGASAPSQTWTLSNFFPPNSVIWGITLSNPTVPSETGIYASVVTFNAQGAASGTLTQAFQGYPYIFPASDQMFGQTVGIAVTQSGGANPSNLAMVDQSLAGVDFFGNSYQQTGKLKTGGLPEFITFNSALSDLFVANQESETVVEYSWPAHKIINTFSPPGGANKMLYGVAVTPAGTYH